MPIEALPDLIRQIEAEARRAPFPIDREPYEKVGKDPLSPIACGGSPSARVCSFGRDPGRDEVRYGQPQVGAAGKLVRRGVLEAVGSAPAPGDPLMEAALKHIFLSNTVPYKPPGNKAYPDSVKERFRPYIERLLLEVWEGDVVLTLGTQAFNWFAPYAEPGAAALLWKHENRYERGELSCVISGGRASRRLTVCPLPHPSPLNQRWVRAFPGLLAARLSKFLSA